MGPPGLGGVPGEAGREVSKLEIDFKTYVKPNFVWSDNKMATFCAV